MDYLPRNQEIIDEIGKNLTLERRVRVGSSRSVVTTAVGNYISQIAGNDVYICLKELTGESNWTAEERVVAELAIIRGIALHYPALIPKLPLFLGLLVGSDGNKIGIITDDFSKGGQHTVREATDVYANPQSEIPEILLVKQLINNPEADLDYDLARMCFQVNGEVRLGDFAHLRLYLRPEDRLFGKFGIFDIERNLGKYMLHANYRI